MDFKCIIAIGIGLLLTSFAFGQIVIEGVVKDKENREGLPFAHVSVEETANVVVSDMLRPLRNLRNFTSV